jgi:hypothetical protein
VCKESVKKASKLSNEKSIMTRQKAKNNKITKSKLRKNNQSRNQSLIK